MPQLAGYSIIEKDLAFGISPLPGGIFGVIGRTERGEINDPKRVISSWPEYQRYYGGFLTGTTFPQECKKALDGGARLRICRVATYTDILVPGSLTAVKAVMNSTNLLTFNATNFVTGNNIVVTINGTAAPAVPFNGTHDQTLLDLANSLKTNFPLLVQAAQVLRSLTPGTNTRTILIGRVSGATISTLSAAVTGGAQQATATNTAFSNIVNAGSTTLLTITPKGHGASYNKLLSVIKTPSNGQLGFFDVEIKYTDGSIAEVYPNLYLKAVGTVGEQAGMVALANSALVDFSTPDLTAVTDLSPVGGIFAYSTGSDGTLPVTDISYIGNSASSTGLHSFNQYDDIWAIAIPEKGISGSVAVNQAGLSYALNRKDLVFLHLIESSLGTANAINSAINAINEDSSFSGFYGGGNITTNPSTGLTENLTGMGDILGLIASTHRSFGYHYSFAGRQRGVILNSQGPVVNFGTQGNKPSFELIAQNRANMIILKDNKVYLWGNFTAQKALSPLSYMNVRFLLISIRKVLMGILEDYIEWQNTPETWHTLYLQLRGYFNELSASQALYGGEGKGWNWKGDQFANPDLSNLVINNANDVGLGKYKAHLFLKPVPSLQQLEVTISITSAGVSISEGIS